MTKRRHSRYIGFLMMAMLLIGGMVNDAWAYKVTYHILTLPIDNSIYHLNAGFSDKRLEAVIVVDNSAAKVDLPAPYKSPLAKNFRYYLSGSNITSSGSAVAMYEYSDKNKSYHYTIEDEADSITTASYTISENIEVYVTYEYDADNTIYKLDGSKDYNLSMSGGFMALNRGRNNRIAIIPETSGRVSAEALASDDFVKIDVKGIPGTNISDYWSNGNPNPKTEVAGQFYFKFQFMGSDPYNFLIRTAYAKDSTYLEKHGSETSTYYKYYKNSTLFWPSSDGTGFFMSSDDHKYYTTTQKSVKPNPTDASSTSMTGYFKSKGSTDLVYNSFALLYNSAENGYVFMITRYVGTDGKIKTPGDYKSAKYRFLTRDGNFNNLKSEEKTLPDVSQSSSTDERTYIVYDYVYKVRKKISGDELSVPVQVSEYYTESSPLDFVPEALKRKYVTFTGAYKENTFDNSFATLADVDANATTETIDGKVHKVIWLKYETSMPFETWTKDGGSDLDADNAVDFDELKWYNFYVNKNANNSAFWDGTQIKTSAGSSKYARASHFAFVGDPYDLTIVGRKASEDGSGNPSTLNYMKLDATLENNTAFAASGTTWSIVYDDNTGDYNGCFRLKDNDGEKYLHRNTTTDNPLNGTATSAEAVRITVASLPTKPFVYYIMRLDGSIAVKATGEHEPSAKLGFNTIPEIIRSPFINGRTLSFYGSYTETQGGATDAKSEATAGTPTIAYAKDIEDNTVQYIVARYDFPSAGNQYYAYINGSVSFNVRLNGEYIYYEDGTIKSKDSPTDEELETYPYLWTLGGADPYAMTIRNEVVNKYVTAGATDKSDLGWDATVSNATKFVIKGGTSQSVYEVMYATGDGVDASTTYYNIGRDGTGTKIFQNTTYAHGYDQLRFQLTAKKAHRVTYHLIDKSNKELLQVVARHSPTESPLFPNDYSSPMVSQYHYWVASDFNVVGDIYSLKESRTELSTVGSETDIYVTYDTDDRYDLQSKRTMYLLEYDMGESFYQEDGADGLTTETQKAVYPYCNGDGNFFVYGREQYDIQQQTAASTRTRWAWFLESVHNDPYHVMICSRQIETYSGYDHRAYFRTYAETFGDGTTHVVTNLSWPGISGEQGTEYMMLGSTGQFRLVTSAAVNDGTTNVRRVVNSFEQYWKTWNTIRLKVLGDKNAVARQSDPNIIPESPAAPTAAEAGVGNRTYLTDNMGWHSYEQWAYAIRWNDYNKAGDKNKKGWEDLEHWFQTISMGEGYFNLVPVKIDPVLILLDKHGWEIMRKSLPSDPTDPDKDAKYDVIRPYDSPMIKEYHFWGSAKKRSGYHQYYDLSGRMKVDGKDYTSTSLTKLPDYYNSDGTRNTTIIDAKGNLLDQYVTYVVKDEYDKNYNSGTMTGSQFLIQQGSHFASATNEGTTITDNNVPADAEGGMSQYIITNVNKLTVEGAYANELWYVKPNPNIDQEMGYDVPGNPAHSWTSAEGYTGYTGEFSDGFDPYNIQISSVVYPSAYFVTNATTAQIEEGATVGNGATNTLGAQKTDVTATLSGGMDNRTLQMTNATFMAVRDRAGNMQLMPRFDQHKRLKDFTALVSPDDGEVTKTYTKLYRPKVYTYKILDNTGNESLRYQSGGDLIPQTPAHFKSPLAKDFVYCANSTLTDTITGSLDGATLTDNTVYVRYSYNEEADEFNMLKGRWLTMQLNNYDMYYNNGIYDDISSSKPATIDAAAKKWQWKFLATPFSEPDPYAVPLYNRDKTDGEAIDAKGAILSHTSGGYALIKAGTQDMNYRFLKSNETTSSANTWDTESGFQSTSCAFDGTKSQIKLINEVSRRFNYRVYTNGGVLAVNADQDNTIEDNTPTLPDEIKSPLLNTDQFRYYEALTDTAANSGKALQYLYGLYDDIVYVRYNAYDLKETEYKVPNVRNDKSEDPVAKGEDSNDASLDINGELIYNIIWYADNMMQSTDGSTISGLADQDLQGGNAFVWQFEGNDPYAIKIKHKNSGKYADGTATLNATPSTFMLLPSDDWEYGILQKTGTDDKLTEYGQTTTTGDAPNKFIIFGLSTHKVIYHLIIANIDTQVKIPYSDKNNPIDERYDEGEGKLVIDGTSCRDLTTATSGVTGDKYQLGETKSINGNNVTYCVDDGHITLGDPLKVPDALKRPNCKYFFYVDGIYNDEACTSPQASLNTLYQGMRITEMGTEPDLLGKTVVINIEYEFDDGLTETNTGNHFVTNSHGTEWYTFETSDETPYLARYTYYSAKVSNVEGRAGHYTNEYLWSPVGDPYGFKMYNRYVFKNGDETTTVMTTASTPAADADLIMKEDATNNPVYELLAGNHEGDFKVQTLTVPGSGTPLYLDNHNGVMKLKTSTTTEWHFGLDQTLFDPYYIGAGNVGGLTTTVKAGTGKEKSGKELYEEATNIMEKQAVVYDPDNIVDFTPGYYRIFNQPNSSGITTPRYLSGYTHKTELTPGTGTEVSPEAIPMHFYERSGVTTSFDILGSGFTVTAATQGQIPIEAPEYDPASIFYITGTATAAQMSTQGLYVKENKMTETSGEATTFHVIDIGGAVVLIHDGNATHADRKYLHYKQSENIYDVKFNTGSEINDDDAAKWCMEPANKKGLWIETHSGGEEETLTNLWYYATICVPFDMLISNKNEDPDHSSNAYTCVPAESPWTGGMLHPKPMGKYNVAPYENNDYFVPAGTPVLFSTRRATSYIKATIPTATPSTPITTIFSYEYLEQLLTPYDDNRRVYVFGPKMEGTITLNNTTGAVTAVLPSLGNTNVGFHINANLNKESALTWSSWTRNNYYVLHNKIYYRAPAVAPTPAPGRTGPEFVPVLFGDEEQPGMQKEQEGKTGDGCVYDLLGRKVATAQEAADGTWRHRLGPGVYIIDGKKIVCSN